MTADTTETNGDVDTNLRIEYEIQDDVGPKRCAACRASCLRCLKPILSEYNLPPTNPNLLEELHYAVMCPPRGRLGACILVLLAGALSWGVLWSITGEDALPGGNLFSLVLLFLFCWIGGYIMNLIHLPPLLGMLIVGGVLGSVKPINIAKDIDDDWDESMRQIALAIILIRAGLGLDPAALRRLSFVVVRLAFSPCLSEAITDGIAAHLILGFPWEFSLMLGFVIAAVSPAVVVPCLLGLSERGYGVDKGVPTLVIAAASIDDVLAITGFGVTLGIASSEGNLVWNIFKGPIEAILGVIFGIVGGIVLWYIPQRKSKHLLFFRCVMLLGGGLFVIFGSKKVEWDGIGPLGCLTLAFVAAIKWRQEKDHKTMPGIVDVVGVLWMLFQPLLFGLIGAAVQVDALEAKTVGLGIAVLGIGLGVRMVVAFCAVLGTNLNTKERLFVSMAWLPKATVQAAIGALALDWASEYGTEEQIKYSTQILILAVLSILLTAPTGAILVTLLGPRLLKYTPSADHIHRQTEIIFEEPKKPDKKEPVTSEETVVTSDHADVESCHVITRATDHDMSDGGEGGGKAMEGVMGGGKATEGDLTDRFDVDIQSVNVEKVKLESGDDKDADDVEDNTDSGTSVTKL